MDHQDARFLDLLRKWQSGDFTRRDEQEMEALTQADDFRRETWQGFLTQPEADHEGDLAVLRGRLKQQSGSEQLRPVSTVRPWLMAAAVLVVVLVALVFFRPSPQQGVAALVPEQDSTLAVAGEDAVVMQAEPVVTSPSGNGPMPVASAPALRQAEAGPVVTVASEAAEAASADLAATSDDSRPPAEHDAMPPVQQAKQEEEVGSRMAAKPVEKKKETAGAAAPLRAVPTKADTLWTPTGAPPDMVKRRKAAREANLPAQSAPADGWEAFEDYLRQTARLTPTALEKGVSGTVRVQFTVSENGEPQGFTTLRSVGYGCDQEALRLIKDWVWVRGQNPVIIVEVPFVR